MGRRRSSSRVATLLTVGSLTLSVVFAGAAWASSADTGHGASQSRHGANQSGPYNATPSGPSGNGNGGGEANGKPCAGCVGNADNKNPKGQLPGGSDHNNGYECDANFGIAKTNPAHTSCTGSTGGSGGSGGSGGTGGTTGDTGGATGGTGGTGSTGGGTGGSGSTGGGTGGASTGGGTGGASKGGGSTTNGGGGTGGSDPGSKVEVAPVSFSRPALPVQVAEAVTDPSTPVAAAVPETDPATPAVEAAFKAQPGSLPFTGFNTIPLLVGAMVCLAAGAALQLRRRPATRTEG